MADTLEQIDKELKKLYDTRDDVGAKINELVDKRNVKKVEEFDTKLVEEARSIGVNPANFESNDHLKEGIKLFRRDNEVLDLPKPQQPEVVRATGAKE